MKNSASGPIAIGVIASFVAGIILGVVFTYTPKIPAPKPEKEYLPVPELSEWSLLQLAIIKTESEFNSLAVGATKDIGLFQMTPIYVEEVNRILKMQEVPDSLLYTHLDAFDDEKSFEMFDIMQGYYNPTHSVSRAILKHNPGGNAIGYAKRVHENMDLMRNWEDKRNKLLKYQMKCTDQ